MTVNERLHQAGLIEAFDAAARSRDRAHMIEILERVEVGDATGTVDAILEKPGFYGF
jgi:hypothetical protein